MSRIPSVKAWKVTLEDGRIYYVNAPTKLLAKLVLRDPAQPGTWGAIKSIGFSRSAPLTLHGLQIVRVK